MRTRILFQSFCFFMAFFAGDLFAMYEYIGMFTLTQPNGIKIEIRRGCDEFGTYDVASQGRVIQREDGYYCYGAVDRTGNVYPTDIRVGIDESERKDDLAKLKLENCVASQQVKSGVASGDYGLRKVVASDDLLPLPDSLIVILVEFSDIKHRINPCAYTTADFESMLFSENNYVHPDGRTTYGSLRKYYRDMSGYPNAGYFDLKGRVANSSSNGIPNWVVLPDTKASYHAGSKPAFIQSALVYAAQAGIDTTHSATRKIAVIYAGNMYSSGGLHPCAVPYSGIYTMCEQYRAYSGMEYSDAVFTHIGTHAHEFGHLLGFPDTYDTSGNGGAWDLMATGDSNPGYDNNGYDRSACPAPIDPFMRIKRGWLTATRVQSLNTPVSLTFDSNFKDTDVVQVNSTFSDGQPSSSDFFLLENRQMGSGWNTWPSMSGEDDGLLIWHIFGPRVSSGFMYCTATLIAADNDWSPISCGGDAYRAGHNATLTDYTTPNSRYTASWNVASNVIIRSVSSSGPTMTAIVSPYWGGELYDNVSWDDIAEVYVGDDLYVPASRTLTIAPRCVHIYNYRTWIRFANGKKLKIRNGGTVVAGDSLPKSTNAITLFDGTSSWGGIDIETGGRLIATNAIDISNATCGITVNGSDCISGDGNAISISYSTDAGIRIKGGSPVLSNLTISNCTVGIDLVGNSATPLFSSVTVSDALTAGIQFTNCSRVLPEGIAFSDCGAVVALAGDSFLSTATAFSVTPNAFRIHNSGAGSGGYYSSISCMLANSSPSDSMYITASASVDSFTVPADRTLTVNDGATVSVAPRQLVWNEGYQDWILGTLSPLTVKGRLVLGNGVTFKSSATDNTEWSGISIASTGKMIANGTCRITNATTGIAIRANADPINHGTNRIAIDSCGCGVSVGDCSPNLNYFTINRCSTGLFLIGCSGTMSDFAITNCYSACSAYQCSPTFRDMDLTKTGSGVYGGSGIRLANYSSTAYACSVYRVTMRGFEHGIDISGFYTPTVSNCTIDSCTSGAYLYTSYSNQPASLNMYQSRITNCNYCIYKTGSGSFNAMYNTMIPKATTTLGRGVYLSSTSATADVDSCYWGGTPDATMFKNNVTYAPYLSVEYPNCGDTRYLSRTFSAHNSSTGKWTYCPSVASMILYAPASDSMYINASADVDSFTVAAGRTLTVNNGVTLNFPHDCMEYNIGADDYFITHVRPLAIYGTLNVGSGVTFTCDSDTVWTGMRVYGTLNANGPFTVSNAYVGIYVWPNAQGVCNGSNRIALTDCWTGIASAQCANDLHDFDITNCSIGASLTNFTRNFHNATIRNCWSGIRAFDKVNISNVDIKKAWDGSSTRTGNGIYISWPSGPQTIEEVTIHGYDTGIYTDGTSYLRTIRHCEIDSCKYGIAMKYDVQSNIYLSKIRYCNYCIYGMYGYGTSNPAQITMNDGSGYGHNTIIPCGTATGRAITNVGNTVDARYCYWGPGGPTADMFSGSVTYTSYLTSEYTGAGRVYPNNNKIVASDKEEQPEQVDETLENAICIAPNPANPVTTITYSLAAAGNVKLTVYAVNGQKVATLVNGPVSAGRHSATFNGAKLASGVYFYRFESAGMNKTGKIMLLK